MISISTGKEWIIFAGIIAIVGIAALAASQISGTMGSEARFQNALGISGEGGEGTGRQRVSGVLNCGSTTHVRRDSLRALNPLLWGLPALQDLTRRYPCGGRSVYVPGLQAPATMSPLSGIIQ
jgi:hypothetical protein